MSLLATRWRDLVAKPTALVAIWALYCVVGLGYVALGGAEPAGPDDYMRLFQVRDLLAGQSWWDVTQYRVDPPGGASMHWSRLVDLPLAFFALLFGETVAQIAVPLLYLLAAMFCLRAILLRLGLGPGALLAGLLILPLFPLLPGTFAPMRIDHHTPQAVLGLACAALLLQNSRAAAAIAGALAGTWCAISLEGLPMAAALAGIYGVLYLWLADRRLQFFLAGLAVSAPGLSLLTRPPSEFDLPYCDILLPGHMAAFGVAAIFAASIPRLPAQDRVSGRLLALAGIPLLCAPVAFLGLGECVSDPFARLDPLLQQYWHGYITEGLPIWEQPVSMMAVLVWTLALVAAGYASAMKQGVVQGERALAWASLAMIAAAACLYSFWLMRAAILAQLLAIPFAAYLIAHYLPRARSVQSTLPRIAATLACLLLATPVLVSAAFKPLDPSFPSATMSEDVLARIDPRPCDFGRLAPLAPGNVLTPLDSGPEILGKSGHTIVMASYHRNQQRMRDVITTYTGNANQARFLLAKMRADYVVACASEPDLALYRTAAQDNFANNLVSGDVPHWLQSIAGFEDSPLRVYRVR